MNEKQKKNEIERCTAMLDYLYEVNEGKAKIRKYIAEIFKYSIIVIIIFSLISGFIVSLFVPETFFECAKSIFIFFVTIDLIHFSFQYIHPISIEYENELIPAFILIFFIIHVITGLWEAVVISFLICVIFFGYVKTNSKKSVIIKYEMELLNLGVKYNKKNIQ